jgi:sigma-B regulation protein RsbU (phosphoserine phosphatase)
MKGEPAAREPGLFDTLKQDVGQVRAHVRREGLWASARRTLAELEAFYLSAARRQRLAGMGTVRRWVYFAAWLLKSLFLRLTPVRRVLLLLGLVFTVSFRFSASASGVQVSNTPAAGIALVLLVLLLELKDKLLARDELAAGRAVQLALLPAHPPGLTGWDIHLYTRSANDVGGDLVDWQDLGEGCVGLAVADVSGKGLGAALLMARLQATLRALAPDVAALPELGARANRIFRRDGLPNSFATLVYLELTAGRGTVTLLNAGHMPPLVLRRGSLDELPRGGPALGILPEVRFDEQRIDLQPGETLVVCTDGVTEAMNEAGDFFGEERLRPLVAPAAGLAAERVAARIVEAVDRFVGRAPAHDDVSLAVVRRTG